MATMTPDERAVLEVLASADIWVDPDDCAEQAFKALRSMDRPALLRALGMEFMSITVGSRDEERIAQMERGERPLGPYISWEGWVDPGS